MFSRILHLTPEHSPSFSWQGRYYHAAKTRLRTSHCIPSAHVVLGGHYLKDSTSQSTFWVARPPKAWMTAAQPHNTSRMCLAWCGADGTRPHVQLGQEPHPALNAELHNIFWLRKKWIRICNSSTYEAEVWGLLQVENQPGLQGKIQLKDR